MTEAYGVNLLPSIHASFSSGEWADEDFDQTGIFRCLAEKPASVACRSARPLLAEKRAINADVAHHQFRDAASGGSLRFRRL